MFGGVVLGQCVLQGWAWDSLSQNFDGYFRIGQRGYGGKRAMKFSEGRVQERAPCEISRGDKCKGM